MNSESSQSSYQALLTENTKLKEELIISEESNNNKTDISAKKTIDSNVLIKDMVFNISESENILNESMVKDFIIDKIRAFNIIQPHILNPDFNIKVNLQRCLSRGLEFFLCLAIALSAG